MSSHTSPVSGSKVNSVTPEKFHFRQPLPLAAKKARESVEMGPGVVYNVLTPEQMKSVKSRLKALSMLKNEEPDPFMRAQYQKEYRAILSEELESNAATTELRARRYRKERDKALSEAKYTKRDKGRLAADVNRLSGLLSEQHKLRAEEKLLWEKDVEEMGAWKREAKKLEEKLEINKRSHDELKRRAEEAEAKLEVVERELKHSSKRMRHMQRAVFDFSSTFADQFPKIESEEKF